MEIEQEEKRVIHNRVNLNDEFASEIGIQRRGIWSK